ncbi:citrate (Si)-synthase [Intrasporangium oryzae NRRL B-24470]|uniref:Citrate synthase n=1 Tax=Intrasporangium oryzae NRRL B-24470 TaxID=1386089 RepID=W9G6H6_9MICO|nr:citrate/2-methylcitrate synthase [Intrasporangium oryzae]EWT00912.1 citrate (Si)-synthase [Intrasporangium oryzae NRRL B-24470]
MTIDHTRNTTSGTTGDDGFVTVPPGLAKVVVTDTELGDVRGAEGFYHYRQYSAVDVAEHATFEQAAHLLVHGHLPDAAEEAAFRTRLGALRVLPDELAALLPAVCATTDDPLQVLRTALSAWGGVMGLRPLYDASADEALDAALAAVAVTPTILAAAHRISRGLEPVAPDPSLPHAEDYLRMVAGTAPSTSSTSSTASAPSARDVRAVEQYLVSTMDHGFNASTFTARVIASTGADLAACLVGALGSFSGPKHGGAPSRALEALDEIGTVDRAEPYVRERITKGERVMGFGHAVYRTKDPRSEMLKAVARRYDDPLVDFAVAVEDAFDRSLAELKPGRELHANVEFYAGVVMKLAGLDPSMFTPTFCVARVVGWTANILEQARDPKIIRPAARYVGPTAPQPMPHLLPEPVPA